MSKRPHTAADQASVALGIAHRMRAHARLCHQIAVDSWDECVADEFARLAAEFMEMAEQIEEECVGPIPRGRLH
jgi:hypothetical protein